jgi:selenide,water dikinase
MSCVRRLLLVGGGHAHVEVLRRFGLVPEPGLEIVLVSPAPATPYSGMLPGLVAGHYRPAECHIDLPRLCRFAGARFVQDVVTGLPDACRGALLESGGRLEADLISLDVGSTPPRGRIAGADRVGTGVKPVDAFLAELERRLSHPPAEPARVLVVGAGAGGVEIALALQHRLGRADAAPGVPEWQVGIVSGGPVLLPGHGQPVRRRIAALLDRRGLSVRLGVPAAAADAGGLWLADGTRLEADWVVWATGAAPPRWLRDVGLALDAQGFVLVDDSLRSVSHPGVFAAGDVASPAGRPHPKSGVHAVRQGLPLAANLRRALTGQRLLTWEPQRRTLALLATGPRHAVASWGGLSVAGAWVWHWKDRIDRGFMRRYQSLSAF